MKNQSERLALCALQRARAVEELTGVRADVAALAERACRDLEYATHDRVAFDSDCRRAVHHLFDTLQNAVNAVETAIVHLGGSIEREVPFV